MKTTMKLLILAFTLGLMSCGGNNNRTNSNGLGDWNNLGNVNTNGLAVNVSLSTKLTRIETAFQCQGNARRYTIGFAVQQSGGQSSFIGRRTVSLSASNARGYYVGKTQFNDIVLVKELDDNIREIRVRLCDVDRYGAQAQQITGSQIYSNFALSNQTSCTVNQISQLDFSLLYGNGLPEIFMQVYPVNADGPIDGICPTDFYSDPVLHN